MTEQPVADPGYSSQKVSRIVLHHHTQKHQDGHPVRTRPYQCRENINTNTLEKAQITANEEPHKDTFAKEVMMCLKRRARTGILLVMLDTGRAT